MKICLCCGAQCAPDAPHCLACGEASFEFTIQAPVFSGDPAAPVRLGAGGDVPPAVDPPQPDAEETEPSQVDLLPGAPAAPSAKRGPGRPRRDPPN